MVLPVDGASGERWQPVVREPRHLGEAALDRRFPPEAQTRSRCWWNHTETEGCVRRIRRVRDPRLHFRERTPAGVVDAAQSAPAIGKVPVQINAVRVPARFMCTAVGIQHGHDPEVEPGGRVVQEIPRDGDPCGLVAVDAAHNEDGDAGRIADFVRDDRPALHRAAEQLAVRRRGRRDGHDQRGSESSFAPPAAPRHSGGASRRPAFPRAPLSTAATLTYAAARFACGGCTRARVLRRARTAPSVDTPRDRVPPGRGGRARRAVRGSSACRRAARRLGATDSSGGWSSTFAPRGASASQVRRRRSCSDGASRRGTRPGHRRAPDARVAPETSSSRRARRSVDQQWSERRARCRRA